MMRPSLVGRFDDMYSVRLDGAVDEDNIARRLLLRKEETRRRIAERILSNGSIEQMFKKLDEDGSGEISFDELKKGLKRLKLQRIIEDGGEEIMKDMDTDGNGQIDFTEFKTFLETDLSQEKVKRFDAKLEIERRQKMQTHRKGTEATPVAKWHERVKAVPSAYDHYANGQTATACRRTSFAMGFEVNHDRIQHELELRSLDNRNKLRKALKDQIESKGFQKFWSACKPDSNQEVSFRRLKRVLDQWGLSVVHQDSDALMQHIDTNGNGLISDTELKDFLHADPLALDEKAKHESVQSLVKIGKGRKTFVNQIPTASFMQPTASAGNRIRMTNPKLAPLPSASGWRSPPPPEPKLKRKFPPQHSGKWNHAVAPYNYPTRRMVTERKKAERERVTQMYREKQRKRHLFNKFGWKKRVMPLALRTI